MKIGMQDINNLDFNKKNKYYIENNKIDIKDTNSRYVKIVNKINKKTNVLDVGCSYGLFGEYLKKQKQCNVHGIEIDEISLEITKKGGNYSKTYNFSIIDKSSKEYIEFFEDEYKYDYIIFSDVLEHLYDPITVLFEFSKKLKKGGSILISVPNIAHYDIINGMSQNKFNYSDIGILDNTHIRFFTKNSFAQMIDYLNKKYKTNFELDCYDKTISYCDYLTPAEISNILSINDEMFVLQYIFELKISKKHNMLNKLLKENRVNYLSYLEKENEKNKIERQYYQTKFEEVINSKGWKLLNKLRFRCGGKRHEE